MNKLFILLGICVVLCGFSCMGVSEKGQGTKVEEGARGIEESKNVEEVKMEERRKRGDTVAMAYEKLKVFMPTDLQGYVVDGEAAGNFVKQEGVSFSTLRQGYRLGDKRLTVTLNDFNGVKGLYSAALGLYGYGVVVENDEQIVKGWSPEVGSAKGYEQFLKKTKEANVIVGVGNRFVMGVSGTGQENTEVVKAVAKSIKWEGLEKL